MNRQLTVNLGNILLSLSDINEMTVPQIAQHQQRTAYIALEIAKYANSPVDVVEDIFTAALLHDIGALSVEEKVTAHDIDSSDPEPHCIKGEILIGQIPWFSRAASIVRQHHTDWMFCEDSVQNPIVFASQVILLADHVERLIDRRKHILQQYSDIIEKIKQLRGTVFNEFVADCFLAASVREEFWLDIISQKLYPQLLHFGPYRNLYITLDDIDIISEAFKRIIDFKSPFTATHSSGVSACAELMSRIFGLSETDVKKMKIAGDLHDIGKLTIPNSILDKPGRLTSEEFAIIRSHTYYTYYVINTIEGLQHIAMWAAYHHEKLDGTGYPFHCKADEIDTGSRIMAVADIFTALMEDRPYRPGMKKEEIYRIIKSQADAGGLDAGMVDLLFDNYDSIYSYTKEKQALAHVIYEHTNIGHNGGDQSKSLEKIAAMTI